MACSTIRADWRISSSRTYQRSQQSPFSPVTTSKSKLVVGQVVLDLAEVEGHPRGPQVGAGDAVGGGHLGGSTPTPRVRARMISFPATRSSSWSQASRDVVHRQPGLLEEVLGMSWIHLRVVEPDP
jgi:hypothetical protein